MNTVLKVYAGSLIWRRSSCDFGKRISMWIILIHTTDNNNESANEPLIFPTPLLSHSKRRICVAIKCQDVLELKEVSSSPSFS